MSLEYSDRPFVPPAEQADLILQQPYDVNGAEHAAGTSNFRDRMTAAKTAIETAVIAVEVLPLNEALRYGAFAAFTATNPNPILGGLVLGGATLAIEGSAAVATADLLGTERGKKAIAWTNEKLTKIIPEGTKMSLPAEAGLAYLGGSAVVVAEKMRENPERTPEQNRRYGLVTAAWLSGVLAVQGTLAANGIHNPEPETIGLGLLGIASVPVLANWAKKRFSSRKNSRSDSQILSKKSTEREDANNISWNVYSDFQDTTSSPQREGLGEEDYQACLENEQTISSLENIDGQSVETPVLVPSKALYWYNQKLLTELFSERETYIYTQAEPTDQSVKIMAEVIDTGAVVLTPVTQSSSILVEKLQADAVEGRTVKAEPLIGAYLNQYVGEVDLEGITDYIKAPTFFEQYRTSLEDGTLTLDLLNGAALIDSVSGSEASRLWDIYKEPFEEISVNSPINAGFDEEGFYKALQDETVVKVVNRVDGIISTLALFETDIDNAEWLNSDYFEKELPEAYHTDNILLFLGMVSDENMRGNAYSTDLINLLLKVAIERNSKSDITFECNEVSSHYLPEIVAGAINASGIATVRGLESPKAQTTFLALRSS